MFVNMNTNPGSCCREGVPKVLCKLAEPAASQYEPHGQQALQLWRLWKKLLPSTHPEETPTYPHIHDASAQTWTKTGTVSSHTAFVLHKTPTIRFKMINIMSNSVKKFFLYYDWLDCPSMQVCALDNEGATHGYPCPNCPSRFTTEDQLNHHK